MATKLTMAEGFNKNQYEKETLQFLLSNPDALAEKFFTVSIVEDGNGAIVNVTPARHVECNRNGDTKLTAEQVALVVVYEKENRTPRTHDLPTIINVKFGLPNS
jgi:hypothetical protein